MKIIEKKHPLAIRWFHWINFPVLMVMIWSGLLIYWADDVFGTRVGRHELFHFFPAKFYDPTRGDSAHAYWTLSSRLSEGMAWHFAFMWLFFLNGLAYVLYTAISGEWRYLVPTRHSFREAIHVVLHDLHLTKKPLPRNKFNGAQQFAYTSVILMGAGSLITGLSIYKPVQFAWITSLVGGYVAARFEHFWLTIGYVVFFLIHVSQVIRAGWNNFRAMVTRYEMVEIDGRSQSEANSEAGLKE